MKSTTLRFPLALVLLESTLYLSQDMYLPALPAVQRDFAVSAALAQATFTVWLLGATVLQPLIGPLSDRHGRRRIVLVSAALFVAASAGCAAAPGFAGFVLLRALQGGALCGVLAAGYACVHESLGSHDAVRTQAWMSAVTVLAPALGPLLGALLLLHWAWPALFTVLAALGALATAMLQRWMPETVDVARAARLSWRRSAAAYAALLMQRGTPELLGAACLLLAVLLAWNVTAPFVFADDTGGFVAAQAWLYAMFIVGTRVVARHVGHRGADALVRAGLHLGLLGAALGALAALLRLPTWCTLGAFGLYPLADGMLFAPLLRIMLERASAAGHPMGTVMALWITALNLVGVGCTLGVAWAGWTQLHELLPMAALLAAGAWVLGRRGLRNT
jgi:MFS family permease